MYHVDYQALSSLLVVPYAPQKSRLKKSSVIQYYRAFFVLITYPNCSLEGIVLYFNFHW